MLILDIPADCTTIYNKGEHTSGIYSIRPSGSEVFNVYCEVKSGKTGLQRQRTVVSSGYLLPNSNTDPVIFILNVYQMKYSI